MALNLLLFLLSHNKHSVEEIRIVIFISDAELRAQKENELKDEIENSSSEGTQKTTEE